MTWGRSGGIGGGIADVPLDWSQLESACRYYVSRGRQVSVYLPPLRPGHEAPLERCRQSFGDIFVACCSVSDDLFMINTVKLYEEARVAGAATEAEVTEAADAANGSLTRHPPSCFIVTNDRFEDWRRKGNVDAAWVERHCVRFAFLPGGLFVPSELL